MSSRILFVLATATAVLLALAFSASASASPSRASDVAIANLNWEEIPPIVLQRYHQRLKGFQLIVGGEEVDPEFSYPWTASLQYLALGHFCGGSLINSTWILTAAHCSTNQNPNNLRVELRRHDLSESVAEEGAVERRVRAIHIHPEYKPLFIDNDVALWELDEPVTDVETIQYDANGDYDYAGQMSTVVGWGATRESGSGSDVLMEVEVPLITNEECEEGYPGSITDSMICAGYDEGGKDACQGDSGGPLFVYSGSRPIQVGVVSWGEGCARAGRPGVYARVSYLSDFIEETIGGK